MCVMYACFYVCVSANIPNKCNILFIYFFIWKFPPPAVVGWRSVVVIIIISTNLFFFCSNFSILFVIVVITNHTPHHRRFVSVVFVGCADKCINVTNTIITEPKWNRNPFFNSVTPIPWANENGWGTSKIPPLVLYLELLNGIRGDHTALLRDSSGSSCRSRHLLSGHASRSGARLARNALPTARQLHAHPALNKSKKKKWWQKWKRFVQLCCSLSQVVYCAKKKGLCCCAIQQKEKKELTLAGSQIVRRQRILACQPGRTETASVVGNLPDTSSPYRPGCSHRGIAYWSDQVHRPLTGFQKTRLNKWD